MLDRTHQREILEALAGLFPEGSYDVDALLNRPDTTTQQTLVNVQYLAEHGLLSSGYKRMSTISNNGFYAAGETSITAKGLDLLADDGGLGAVLGVVTIKIHDDTIRQLIERRVLESDLPPPDKKRLIDQLQSLPGETIKHLALKLVDKGLANGPQAIEWLESAYRSLG
jgi:hypothetical protein